MVDVGGERDPEMDAAELDEDPERPNEPEPVAGIAAPGPPSGGPVMAAVPGAYRPGREQVLPDADEEEAERPDEEVTDDGR